MKKIFTGFLNFMKWIISPICEQDGVISSRRTAAIALSIWAGHLFTLKDKWATIGGIACLSVAVLLWFCTTIEEIFRVVQAASAVAKSTKMMRFGSYTGYGYQSSEDKTPEDKT